MRSFSKDTEALESRLLPTATTDLHEDVKKYQRRENSILSSFSRSRREENTIYLLELICAVGAFVVLACYASQPSSSSASLVALNGSFEENNSGRQPPSFLRSRALSEPLASPVSFTSAAPSLTSTRPQKSIAASKPLQKKYPRIAAAITTSKRPELFRRAYLSFRLRCLDCDATVSQWFAVDDGSADEQLEAMRSVSSDITWLSKNGPKNQTAGHVSSLNRVLEEVVDDFDYLVFLEDDFFFVQDEDYISKALNIFGKNDSIGQIVFIRV